MWRKNTLLEDDLVKLDEFRSRHPNAEEVENCMAWSHWVSGEYDCDLLPTEAGFFCHSCGEEIASEEHYRICLSLSVDDLSEIVVSYPVVAALREAEVGHSSAFDDSRHPTDEDIYRDGIVYVLGIKIDLKTEESRYMGILVSERERCERIYHDNPKDWDERKYRNRLKKQKPI